MCPPPIMPCLRNLSGDARKHGLFMNEHSTHWPDRHNVRYGSKADIGLAVADVRFGSKAQISASRCSLYPQNRTSIESVAMSALRQKRTSCAAAKSIAIDHERRNTRR